MAVGVAILGAGIYARDEHLPAIQNCSLVSLKAVYSRSQSSAEKLAKDGNVDSYFDFPSVQDRSLDTLLERDDIHAVTIALPIPLQSEYIRRSLSAGKHVLSEKPIAKDIATAENLIDFHRKLSHAPVWGVAENFRFVEFMTTGAEKVKELAGKVVTFQTKLNTLMKDDDKFLNTEWRKIPDYQGGFLLDGGVHFVGGARFLLAAAGEKVVDLSAFSDLLRKKLPPVDTLHSIWRLESGAAGTFVCSWSTEHKSGLEFEIVTTKGRVTVTPTSVVVTTKSPDGKDVEDKTAVQSSSGVAAEVETFARGIRDGKLDTRLAPGEVMGDLLVMESMLKSHGTLKTL